MQTSISKVSHRTSLRAVPQRPVSARARRFMTISNFKSDRSMQLLKAAKVYIDAWRPESFVQHESEQLANMLKEVVAPGGLTYLADGVVHPHDRHKTVSELADHIRERYAAYKHVVHEPFAMAVDEEHDTVFVGLLFMMQNTGPLLGREPTGRPTKGVLLERLGFDESGKLTTALVCRQLTAEEVDRFTVDPSEVKVPDVDDGDLFAPDQELSPADTARMTANLSTWVHSWDSGSSLGVLDSALDPSIRQLSGYGLGKHSVPFMGIDAAREAIIATHDRLHNTNDIVAHALCENKRAGFVHWRANAVNMAKQQPERTEGLDYVRFNERGQVAFIYSFTMRPYSNVRMDLPRTAGVD